MSTLCLGVLQGAGQVVKYLTAGLGDATLARRKRSGLDVSPGCLSAPLRKLLCVNSYQNASSAHNEGADASLRRLAARQFGLLSRAQVLQAGLGAGAVTYRIGSGEWRRVLPSVYSLGVASRTWPQPLMAALLWAGPKVVSHRAAGALWKLDGIEAGTVELTTSGTRSDVPPGMILHRTQTLGRSDFGTLGPFRVTGLVRTVLDLAAVVDDPALLEAAAESAARLDETLWSRLAARVGHARGRHGAATIGELVRARDPKAAPSESLFETRLLQLLREAGLELPVRQLVVPVDGPKTPRVDFAYPNHRLVIEADGYWCHAGRARWQAGLHRGNALVLEGWRPLNVSWDDLTLRPEQVVGEIRKALARYP